MYGVLRVGPARVPRVRVPVARSCDRSRSRLREQRLHLARRRLHHRVAARAEGQRGAAFGDDRAREVDQDRRQFVAVQVQPDRVPRVRHEAQDGARLAARRGAPAGVRDQALLPEPRRDLADALRGEARALGQFEPADALVTRRAQQIEYECGVMASQHRQIDPGVSPVHSPIVPSACTLATPLLKWMHD